MSRFRGMDIDFLHELEKSDRGWELVAAGFTEGGALGAILWPAGTPADVQIYPIIIVEEPAQVGRFELIGLTSATVQTMEPEVAAWFVDHSFSDIDQTPAADTPNYALIDPTTGVVLEYVHARLIERQGEISEFDISAIADSLPDEIGDQIERLIIDMLIKALALSNPGLESVLRQALDYANSNGWTVAFGVSANVGGSWGITAGKGIYVGPNEQVGLYDSAQVDAGFIYGVAGNLSLTAVEGGPEKLAGYCYSITSGVSIEIFGGSGSLLTDLQGVPFGWAAEIGLGIGSPAQGYKSISHTRLWDLSGQQ